MSCRALLIWGVAVESPVPFILTTQAVKMRAGPVTAHWQLTHTQTPLFLAWCLSAGLCGKYSLNSWRQMDLSIFSPVLFSRWSSVEPTRSPFSTSPLAVYRSSSSVFSFLTKSKRAERTKCASSSKEKIKSPHCILIVAGSWLSSFKKLSLIDFGKLKTF